MTTLTQLEAKGLSVGTMLSLNEWGVKKIREALHRAGYSQEATQGEYQGRMAGWRNEDKRRVHFTLKGSSVTLSVHKDVDYFAEQA
jgi:hypothetical protein